MQKEPVTVMGIEVLCYTMLTKTELLINEKYSTQKHVVGPRKVISMT
jgi:hypothetical protein